MVVGDLGVGARRIEVRIVRDHPLRNGTPPMLCIPRAMSLSVEKRPLQKPALVFDQLAREAGELGLRTTISAQVLRISGGTSLVTHLRKRLASGFRLVKTRL